LSKETNRRCVETLVTRAYFQLVLISWNENRSRIASVATYGNHEVRLVEILSVNSVDMPKLWVEHFVRDVRVVIDSCVCDDLQAAVIAAEHFISNAKELDGTT
jgi:hypothetical protein